MEGSGGVSVSVNSRTSRSSRTPPPRPGSTSPQPANTSFVPDEATRLLHQVCDEDDEYDFGLTAEELEREVEASLQNKEAPPDRTWAEWFVFMKPAMLIVFWAFCKNVSSTLISPMVPFLLKDYYNGDKAQAAQIQTIFDATRAFIAALLVPIYGNILDNVGRKPFFIFAAIASTLPPAFLIAIPRNPLWYMFFSEVSQVFSVTYTLAYIADCYEERDRAKVFAVVDGVQALGSLMAIGAQFMSQDAIIVVALTFVLIRVPFALFVIPETLNKQQRKPFSVKYLKAHPLKAIRVITKNKVMLALTFIVGCLLITAVGIADITSYFLQQRVNWTQDDGFSFTVENGLLQPFSLLIVYPLVAKYVKPERLILLAFICLDLDLIVLIFLYQKWQVFALMGPLGVTLSLGVPALVGIFSNAGEQGNQGQRMAGISAVMDLINAFAPLGIGIMFAHLSESLNWIPFAICLGLSIPAIIMLGCCLSRWVLEDRAIVLAKSFVESGNTSFAMPGPKPLAVAAVEEAEAKSGRPRANSRAAGSLPGSRSNRSRAESRSPATSLPGSRNNRVLNVQ